MKPDDDSACELYVHVSFRAWGSENRVSFESCFMGCNCMTAAKRLVDNVKLSSVGTVEVSFEVYSNVSERRHAGYMAIE